MRSIFENAPIITVKSLIVTVPNDVLTAIENVLLHYERNSENNVIIPVSELEYYVKDLEKTENPEHKEILEFLKTAVLVSTERKVDELFFCLH